MRYEGLHHCVIISHVLLVSNCQHYLGLFDLCITISMYTRALTSDKKIYVANLIS